MSTHLLDLKKTIAEAIRTNDWTLAAQSIESLCRVEDTAENRMQLAAAYLRADRVEDARAIYIEQAQRQPSDTTLNFNIGLCDYRLKDFHRSLKRFQEILASDPSFYSAQIYAARSLYHLAQFDQVKASCLQILDSRSDKSEVYDLLGHSYRALGQETKAIQAYSRSLEISPQHRQTLMALAITYEESGDTKHAIHFYEACVLVDWEICSAFKNLGRIFLNQGDHQRCIFCLKKAIRLDPNDPAVLNNLGLAHLKTNQIDRAITNFEKALELNPSYLLAWSHLVQAKTLVCDFEVYDDPLVRETTQAERGVLPFAFLTVEDHPQRQLLRSKGFLRHYVKPPEQLADVAAEPVSDGRIRIGYFSSDFKPHATMFLFNQVLNLHDSSQFEVILYDYTGLHDPEVLKALIDPKIVVRDIADLADSEVAELSRRDRLDIAVDLKGFTDGSRTSMFAHRLAPIQVNYLGYPGSIGADWMDYIVADEVVIPNSLAMYYSEKIARLPHCYQPNDYYRVDESMTPSRSSQRLPENAVVFCCFNQNYKITPREIRVWSQVMHEVPNGVLWFLRSNQWAEANIISAFGACGIEKGRLIFAQKIDHQQHLSRHLLADIFLDTFNVNAHTSASDALRASLPVVTLPGEQFAARVASSLVNAMGTPETVASSEEHYIRLAVGLAHDNTRRSDLHLRLRENLRSSQLFSPKTYVSDLETLFAKMYQRQVDGHRPDDLWVDRD